MVRLVPSSLAVALLAAGLVSAAPAPAACQDFGGQVEECMCIYATPAEQFKRSDLVFIGRALDYQDAEPGHGVSGPDSRVIIVQRLEKGRLVGRRIKVLDPPRSMGCTCDSGPPYDLKSYRFYVSKSRDEPGYYVVDALRLPH